MDARARHADQLAEQGAHSLAVVKGDTFGKKGWVIVAYVDPAVHRLLPGALTTLFDGKLVEVPVVVERIEPFEPQ